MAPSAHLRLPEILRDVLEAEDPALTIEGAESTKQESRFEPSFVQLLLDNLRTDFTIVSYTGA